MGRVQRTIPNTQARPGGTPRRARRGWALLGLVPLVAAPAAAAEIVVSAAASLREPLTRLERAFETAGEGSVALSFGASSWLAAQVRAGAPVDVFLSADERQVASLEREGLVAGGTPAVFARNILALVASPRAATWIAAPADLADARLLRFALPPEVVPLGHYARRWLERHELMDALGDRTVQTADARATLAAVDLGQADAALVYATDARLSRRARIVLTPPPEEQPPIVYVGALTPRGSTKPAARAFLAYVSGPGRSELEAAGFLPPRDR